MKNNRRMFLTNGFDLSSAEDFLLAGKHTLGTIFESETNEEK